MTRFVNKWETRSVDGKEVRACVDQPITVLERYEASFTILVPAEVVTGRTVEGKPMETYTSMP